MKKITFIAATIFATPFINNFACASTLTNTENTKIFTARIETPIIVLEKNT